MQIYNLKEIQPADYGEKPQKVFYEGNKFKVRVIKLKAGQKIPECEMSSSVIFKVISGQVVIKVNNKSSSLSEDECLISEPATISMKTENEARIMGIQIEK